MNCNSYRGNKYWCLLVDEISGIICSTFEKNKSDLKDEVIPFIKHIKSIKPISYILCDNEGKNKGLNKSIYPIIITLTFEYTPRDTPKHNGVVESK